MKKIEVHIVGATGAGKDRMRDFILQALNRGIQGRDETPEAGMHHFNSFRHSMLSRMGDSFQIFEHTPGEFLNLIEDKTGNRVGEGLEILANPYGPKGGLPWVKFQAGQGWAIVGGNLATYFPDLGEAVNRWNNKTEERLSKLNVATVSALRCHVNELPGWGDAVRDQMESRHNRQRAAYQAVTETGKEKVRSAVDTYREAIDKGIVAPLRPYQVEALRKAGEAIEGAQMGPLEPAPLPPIPPEICPGNVWHKFPVELNPFHPFGPPIMPPQMLPNCRCQLEDLKATEAAPMHFPEPHPAIVAILDSVGWLNSDEFPRLRVLIPGRLGKEYGKRLQDAIASNNLVAVAMIVAECPAPLDETPEPEIQYMRDVEGMVVFLERTSGDGSFALSEQMFQVLHSRGIVAFGPGKTNVCKLVFKSQNPPLKPWLDALYESIGKNNVPFVCDLLRGVTGPF